MYNKEQDSKKKVTPVEQPTSTTKKSGHEMASEVDNTQKPLKTTINPQVNSGTGIKGGVSSKTDVDKNAGADRGLSRDDSKKRV